MPTRELIEEIKQGLINGSIVPYVGPRALNGVVDKLNGQAIPADSDSLILALNNGQPMPPRLMYEFPRAAMHVENKRGRSFIEKFLTQTYGERKWSNSPLHEWLASLNLPYIIDINRDTQLQQLYQDRAHTLILGASRIAGTQYRFEIYENKNGEYKSIDQSEVNPELPVLFKPMGSPLPKPSYVASDADYVDYITELMGGFAIPAFLKLKRQGKRYLLMGMRLTRDTERMVLSDIIYGATDPSGWVLIPEPNDKERRFCKKLKLELVETDLSELVPGLVKPEALAETA